MTQRSKTLVVATVLATIYALYLFFHFVVGTMNSEGEEAVAGAIATTLVMPHMAMFIIGAVFGWIALFLKAPWSALVAAILYAVGTFFFILYFMYGVPILVLGFVGYSKQKKINKETK